MEHENHQNLGASASRNLGVEQSQGEYIAFLDSDDIYLKNKLEEQVAILSKQSEAGALYASTVYWHSWTGLDEDTRKKRVWDSISIHPDTLIKPPKLLTMFLRNGGTVPCMGSILVRREVIKSLGGWAKSFKTLYDDQVFNAKICLNYSVFVSSGCWDRYRQHPNSTCSFAKKTNQEYYARLRYLLWLENYLIDNGANKDPELWKAFKFAIRPYREPYLHYLLKHYQTSKGWLKRLFDLT